MTNRRSMTNRESMNTSGGENSSLFQSLPQPTFSLLVTLTIGATIDSLFKSLALAGRLGIIFTLSRQRQERGPYTVASSELQGSTKQICSGILPLYPAFALSTCSCLNEITPLVAS
jgi:hypothetical protein